MLSNLTRRSAARRSAFAVPATRTGHFESLEGRTLMSTYYLSPSGVDGNPGTEAQPWRTLQHAADTVASGDELVLAGGDYTGGVTFDETNLTIRAADLANRPVISAPINSTSVQQSLRIGVNGSGATLRGLEIVGGYYYALKLESYWDQTTPGPEPAARNVLVEDTILRDSGRDCVKITPDCNDVTIRRCEIYNSGLRDGTNAEGIDNVNGDNFVLQDTYIHDVATNGVYVKGGATNCVIERNRIENCGSLGISLGFYTDAEFFDPENTTDYYENIDGVVRNNIVVNTNYAGIGLYAALRPRVYNNTLVNVGTGAQAGILFAPGDVAGVTSPTRDAVIVNNVVSAAPGRAVVQVRTVDGAAGLAGSLVMSNNRYHSPSGAPSFRDDRSNFTGTLAQWQALTGTDAASTTGDPGLDGTRHLAAGSPLIDAGTNLATTGGFADDVDGHARPQGAAWDVGADELGDTPAPTPTVPGAPSTLNATAASATAVNLTWADGSSNESGFRIERRTGASGTWTQVGSVAAGVTTYSSTGLTGSTAYQFRVRAYNGAGNSAYSNVASVTTPAVTPGGGGGGGGTDERTFIADFGLVDGRKTKLSWTDGDGTLVTAILGGGGTAQAYVDDAGRLSIDVSGVGPKSALVLKGKGGDGRIALGDVNVSGGLRGFNARFADLSGTAAVGGSIGKLLIGSLAGGTVAAAGNILAATIPGAVTDGYVMAGVSLGADGALGGTGADADVAVTGMIRKLVLGGAVAGSAFTAGALPGANGTYGDGDDTLAGGAASGIGAVVAKNTVDPATRFVAGVFGTVKITGARVVPTADQRFLLLA